MSAEWEGSYPRPMGGETRRIVGRSTPVGGKRKRKRRARKAGAKVGTKSKNYGGLRLAPHKF